MNRRVLFGGIAALALLLTIATGAGVAIAAITGQTLATADPASALPTASPPDHGGASVSPTAAPTVPASPTGYLGPQHLVGSTPTTTDAEIMASAMNASWASDDPANAKIWGEEQILTVNCMAGKGWDYNPLLTNPPFAAKTPGASPTLTWDPAAWLALTGDTGAGDAYRWQDAGCEGYAVHATGNDGDN